MNTDLSCRIYRFHTSSPSFVSNPLFPLGAFGHSRVGAASRSTVVCGKQRQKKKGPAPVQVRPSASPLPLLDMPIRHARNAVTKPLDTAAARVIIQTLAQRRDALILTEAPSVPGGVATVLAQREKNEPTVIIASTRDAVLTVAHEARAVCSTCNAPVIVAAGNRVPGAWQRPAMNANSSKKAVVVVATIRALFSHFLLNGHGRSWLKKIKLLVMLDPAAILSVGARPQIGKVLRAMTPTAQRKNVVFVSRVEGKAQRDAVFLAQRILRPKRRVVIWDDETASEIEQECMRISSACLQHETSLSTFVDHDGVYESLCSSTFVKACDGIGDGSSDQGNRALVGCDSSDTSNEKALDKDRKTTKDLPLTNNGLTHQILLSENLSEERLDRSGNYSHLGLERLMVGDWGSLYKALVAKLQGLANEDNAGRTIVVFPSARLAELYASMCRVDGLKLHDLHRRSTASQRERCLEWLCQEERAVLFASDVITGDVVLPDIALVIMVGLPPQGISGYCRRTCIVRDGGEVWVMVGDREASAVEAELHRAGRNVGRTEFRGGEIWIGEGLDTTAKARAYLSWISAMLIERKRLGWVTRDVVNFVNEWATQLFGEIPPVPNSSVKHMPIRHLDGLRVTVSPPRAKPLTQARNTTRKPKNRFKLKPRDLKQLKKIRESEERLAQLKTVVPDALPERK